MLSRSVSAYKLKRALLKSKLFKRYLTKKKPVAPCNSPNIDLNLLEKLKIAASDENHTEVKYILKGITITLDVSSWDISPKMKGFIHQYQCEHTMEHLSI
jgi:hypothetical protein